MSDQKAVQKPSQGDVVLYSNDMQNFTNPCIAWVLKEPGDTTLELLTFTSGNAFMVRPSVHHKDNPDIADQPGWAGLGVWDFTESAKQEMRRRAEASKPQVQGKGTKP